MDAPKNPNIYKSKQATEDRREKAQGIPSQTRSIFDASYGSAGKGLMARHKAIKTPTPAKPAPTTKLSERDSKIAMWGTLLS